MTSKLYTYSMNGLVSLDEVDLDDFMKELLDTEFRGKESSSSSATLELIEKYGFGWDPLSIPGYLTFRPYAAFMEEVTKLRIWEMVQDFCKNNDFPVQRIAGGDLYSLDKPLMMNHVQLAEEVGMYGDGLLQVMGNQILRFSGCSNKLSLLKHTNFETKRLPVGIFEISDSYRYEKENQLDYLVRNRLFHLPELHIINDDFDKGLSMLLKCHRQMDRDMEEHDLDYIMLFSTTKQFLNEHSNFIEEMCKGCKHFPIINAADDNSCENGIVFDVEYKARMMNGSLVEIGTFQIDEGSTGFAYGITYNNRPVTTVHAVFFASSIERTIYTYCDKAANSKELLPLWLTPVQCRIIPENENFYEEAISMGEKFKSHFRTEVDDRSIDCGNKLEEALIMKVPYIISVGDDLKIFNRENDCFGSTDVDKLFNLDRGASCVYNQFSPMRLSQKIL